jgi:hypothetical protein
MQTVEEYQAKKKELRAMEITRFETGIPTGVQCPDCDGELYEVGARVMTCIPPIRVSETKCNKCDKRVSL